MSDDLSVIQAVARVMADLPAIGKDGVAPASQGGYRFRGIEAVTAALQPLLAKHGVVIVPTAIVDWTERELTLQNKPWTDNRAVVSWKVYGPRGDFFTAETPGIGRDNSDKGSNKMMTAAYKYLLLQVFCIGDRSDDSDGTTVATEWEPEPVITAEQATYLRGLIMCRNSDDRGHIADRWKAELPAPLRDLPARCAAAAEALIREYPEDVSG